MKRTIRVCVVLVATTASALFAVELGTCAKYWVRNDPNARIDISDEGLGPYIRKWESVIPKPTVAELTAIESDAIAWKEEQKKTSDAEFENWTQREKALIKLLIKEINILRVAAGLQPRTAEQIKAALKNEMQ